MIHGLLGFLFEALVQLLLESVVWLFGEPIAGWFERFWTDLKRNHPFWYWYNVVVFWLVIAAICVFIYRLIFK